MAMTFEEAIAGLQAGQGPCVISSLVRTQDDGRTGYTPAIFLQWDEVGQLNEQSRLVTFTGPSIVQTEMFDDRTRVCAYPAPNAGMSYVQNFDVTDFDALSVEVRRVAPETLRVSGTYVRWGTTYEFDLARQAGTKLYTGYAQGIGTGGSPALYTFSIQVFDLGPNT